MRYQCRTDSCHEAYTFPEDLKRAEQSGMSGYIAKPLDMDVLYEKLEQWLVKM